MKRYTGQKALYEAINRSRAKAKRGNILERFLPELTRQEKGPPTHNSALGNPKPPEAPVEPAVVKEPSRPVLERLREVIAARQNAKLSRLEKPQNAEVLPEEPALPPVVKGPPNAKFCVGDPEPWALEKADEKADRLAPPNRTPMWWRLKPLQLNEGRIEISISYHIGLAVALAVLLMILAGFRLGQKYAGGKVKAPVQTNAPARPAPSNAVTETTAVKTPQTDAQGVVSPAGESAQPTGRQLDRPGDTQEPGGSRPGGGTLCRKRHCPGESVTCRRFASSSAQKG